jgi:hypothetical protein
VEIFVGQVPVAVSSFEGLAEKLTQTETTTIGAEASDLFKFVRGSEGTIFPGPPCIG